MVSLVWNLPNGLSGSCQTGEGLTEKGKRFFRRAQKLGMLVDVSHLSEKGFWDMAELAENPIVASHSDSFAVCPHPRNLTDAQFQAICHLGGTAAQPLRAVSDRRPRVTFDDLRRHLDHFLDLGGEGHLTLGADLDGCSVLPEGFAALNDYRDLAPSGRRRISRGNHTEPVLQFFDEGRENMHYVSTRDSSRRLTASQAIMEGLSRDGGLYLPESIPQLTLADIRALARLSYPERAAKIMKLYLEEFSEEELLGLRAEGLWPCQI